MKKDIIIAAVIAAIVAGGLGFYGGIQYQMGKASTTPTMMGAAGQYGSPTGGAGRYGGRSGSGAARMATIGTVLSVDNGSITVKLADGSSKIINVTGSTTYSQNATATVSDVKVGDRVAAVGAANSDGSVTATAVQIGTGSGMMMGGPRPSGMMAPSGAPAQSGNGG